MLGPDGAWYAVGAGIDAPDPSVCFARPVDGSSKLVVLEQDAFVSVGGLDRAVHDLSRRHDGPLLQTRRRRRNHLVRTFITRDLGSRAPRCR